jgi:hypothetical protein
MRTARAWEAALRHFRGVIVANADDPLIVWCVREAHDVVWIAGGRKWLADASSCTVCSAEIVIDDHGIWRCQGCGRGRPATVDHAVPQTGMPGRCNEANASMAYAALRELGVENGAETWADLTSVAGRYEHRTVEGRDVRLLLAKNPAGWLEAFEVIDADRDLVLALNAHTIDGTDPSWIWDVPFERLAPRTVVCSGERAVDLAVRVRHAGLDASIEHDIVGSVRSCARQVDLVANYSAFRDARQRLEPRA